MLVVECFNSSSSSPGSGSGLWKWLDSGEMSSGDAFILQGPVMEPQPEFILKQRVGDKVKRGSH